MLVKLLDKCFDYWDEFWYGHVHSIWDWFWYYRKGKIKFYIFNNGEQYNVVACNGKTTVYNCYGSTIEQAKELAMWRLRNEY